MKQSRVDRGHEAVGRGRKELGHLAFQLGALPRLIGGGGRTSLTSHDVGAVGWLPASPSRTDTHRRTSRPVAGKPRGVCRRSKREAPVAGAGIRFDSTETVSDRVTLPGASRVGLSTLGLRGRKVKAHMGLTRDIKSVSLTLLLAVAGRRAGGPWPWVIAARNCGGRPLAWHGGQSTFHSSSGRSPLLCLLRSWSLLRGNLKKK
jgi:hypothetical protein